MIQGQGLDPSLLNRIDQVTPGGPGRVSSGKGVENAPGFQDILSDKIQSVAPQNTAIPASTLKFSGHAIDRMRSRGISLAPADMARVEQAVQKAQEKGSRETLILMDKAAFIVNIKNNTVVTAMDKNMMKENVFTNIDSTIVL
jgi:flagellar operon protein